MRVLAFRKRLPTHQMKGAFFLLVLAQIAEYILSINSESFSVISIN